MENPPKRKYKKHKQGYTVSVNYVLRKDKKMLDNPFSKESRMDVPKPPIYIRVSFLQQTVSIRSRLDANVTDEEYNDYMQRDDVKAFIETETAAIRFSINEFKPETIDNFLISQWTSFYNNRNVSIQDCAEEVVTKRFVTAVGSKDKIEKDDLNLLSRLISRVLVIKLIGITGSELAQRFYERYKAITNIQDFEKALHDTAIFTLWDWYSGHYQANMLRIHKHKVEEILSLLDSIITEYEASFTSN